MRADLTKVRQVLFNLISNACKFTENGIVTLDVERSTEANQDCFIFRVRDTGIGMEPSQLGRSCFSRSRRLMRPRPASMAARAWASPSRSVSVK